jgi:hypothetical protein
LCAGRTQPEPVFEDRADELLKVIIRQLDRLIELQEARRPGGVPKDLKPKNMGGRPEKYDWQTFDLEVMRIANLDGFSTRDELRRRMIDWITLNWPEQPGDAMLRGKLRKIGDYLKLPP